MQWWRVACYNTRDLSHVRMMWNIWHATLRVRHTSCHWFFWQMDWARKLHTLLRGESSLRPIVSEEAYGLIDGLFRFRLECVLIWLSVRLSRAWTCRWFMLGIKQKSKKKSKKEPQTRSQQSSRAKNANRLLRRSVMCEPLFMYTRVNYSNLNFNIISNIRMQLFNMILYLMFDHWNDAKEELKLISP